MKRKVYIHAEYSKGKNVCDECGHTEQEHDPKLGTCYVCPDNPDNLCETFAQAQPASLERPDETNKYEPTILTCDMTSNCDESVTHVDDKGYVYCMAHGIDRQYYRRCRKLRPYELNRLKRGEQLAKY